MILCDVIIFVSFFALLFVWYFKHKFNYWKSLDVPFIEPQIPYGNVQGHRRKFHSSQLFARFYFELKNQGKFGGIYIFTRPAILVTDLDFLKTVLIKDFQYFHDRGIYHNLKDDPLSGHLLNIEGEYWEKIHERLTPTFTSGRMRHMLPSIVEIGEKLEKFMTKTIEQNPEPEIKEILARFTTDTIGTCAFGIECNSLEDETAKFLEMGRKALLPPNSIAKPVIVLMFPEIAKKLGIKVVREDVSDFFLKIVKDVVAHRKASDIKRNDFIDLLLQLKGDDDLTNEKDLGKMAIEEIAAQVFVFFLAGFETSSATMTFCLHELSLNQNLQEKVRANVQDVLARHDGKITYESLNEMTYLEQCINESLRQYPPGASLFRKVTKDYQVPDSNIVLKKGMTVLASIYGIHHDPDLYPDPEVFDPDRFSQENVSKRHRMAFIPFGEGPRICIGIRFAILQTKVGLATLLSKFKFHKSDRTQIPLQFDRKNSILSPEGGLFLRIEKI